MDYPLCRLFGDTPKIKIMDVLLCKSPMELTKEGVMRYSDLPEFEVEAALADLKDENLVKQTGEYYSCANSKKIKKLRELYITELKNK